VTVRKFFRYYLSCGVCRKDYEIRVEVGGKTERPVCPECGNVSLQLLRTPKAG
jgi:rRNA maturation endonuclease Nob1